MEECWSFNLTNEDTKQPNKDVKVIFSKRILEVMFTWSNPERKGNEFLKEFGLLS